VRGLIKNKNRKKLAREGNQTNPPLTRDIVHQRGIFQTSKHKKKQMAPNMQL
jgi:hypothetical protein